MIYVLIGIIMALVFALCFAVDKLWQHFSKRASLGIGESKVRLSRSNVLFGVLLSVGGLVFLLFFAGQLGNIFYFFGAVILLMGLYLLLNYYSTGIDYHEAGFVYRRPGHRSQTFTYDQILGERAFINRAGINVMLYVGDEEVNLYSSMQGTQAFLQTAFLGWCASRGIAPEDAQAPNPGNMVWFPEPAE